MEAKDTVMRIKDIRDAVDSLPYVGGEHDVGFYTERESKAIAKIQAEISFKAGQKEAYEFGWRTGEKAGTRKVVEWINNSSLKPFFPGFERLWQAKLKEWGIKDGDQYLR